MMLLRAAEIDHDLRVGEDLVLGAKEPESRRCLAGSGPRSRAQCPPEAGLLLQGRSSAATVLKHLQRLPPLAQLTPPRPAGRGPGPAALPLRLLHGPRRARACPQSSHLPFAPLPPFPPRQDRQPTNRTGAGQCAHKHVGGWGLLPNGQESGSEVPHRWTCAALRGPVRGHGATGRQPTAHSIVFLLCEMGQNPALAS